VSLGLLNACRIATSGCAVFCMVLMAARAVRQRRLNGDRFTTWATSALLTAMAFTVIVELRQIGQPLDTWWGLPMLSLMVLFTLCALWRSKV
jgi:hypothetical protein